MRVTYGSSSYYALGWAGPRDHLRQTPFLRRRRLSAAVLRPPIWLIGDFFSQFLPNSADPFGVDPDETVRIFSATDPFGVDPDEITRIG